jgi:hypothetical protein
MALAIDEVPAIFVAIVISLSSLIQNFSGPLYPRKESQLRIERKLIELFLIENVENVHDMPSPQI